MSRFRDDENGDDVGDDHGDDGGEDACDGDDDAYEGDVPVVGFGDAGTDAGEHA